MTVELGKYTIDYTTDTATTATASMSNIFLVILVIWSEQYMFNYWQ